MQIRNLTKQKVMKMKKYQKAAVVAALFACFSLTANLSLYAQESDETATLEADGVDTIISMTPLFDTDGSLAGSQKNPYIISEFDDLKQIATMLAAGNSLEGKYFVQVSDITVNADDVFAETNGVLSLVDGKTITYTSPFASDASVPFKGHYDGLGCTIRGLVLTGSDGASGLFGYAENAEIKNLSIVHSILYTDTAAGAVASKALGTTVISGCSFDGTVKPTARTGNIGYQVGGIVGAVAKEAVVENCVNRAAFTFSDVSGVMYVGGIAGANAGTVKHCSNYADFDVCSGSLVLAAGGIVGDNSGLVAGCFNYGNIRAKITNAVAMLYAGGVIGENSGTTERTQNRGLITALNYETYPCYAGGIVGYGVGGTVKLSDNRGTVQGESSYVGGIAGVLLADGTSASVEESINSGAVSDDTGYAGDIAGWLGASNNAASELALRAVLSLDAAQNAKAVYGDKNIETNATLDMSAVYALDKTQDGVITRTESELEGADTLSGLTEAAWAFPKNGLYPALAVVKNLEHAEVVGLWANAAEQKVAFAVYNPDAALDAEAVVAFCKDGRVLGTTSVALSMTNGYSVYTVDSAYAATADEIRVTAFGSLVTLSPVAEMASFN